jgi:tetratricopeptide (TPR) repeat protein
MANKKYQEAIAKYTEAIGLDPNNAVYYANRYYIIYLHRVLVHRLRNMFWFFCCVCIVQLHFLRTAITSKPLKIPKRLLKWIQTTAKPTAAWGMHIHPVLEILATLFSFNRPSNPNTPLNFFYV